MDVADKINTAIAIGNGAVAIFTALAAWYARKAAVESRRISEKQMEAHVTTERAWLIINLDDLEPQFDEGNAPNYLSGSIKNVGKTPAYLRTISTRYLRLEPTFSMNLSKLKRSIMPRNAFGSPERV
jgi:hypothetical protein